MNHIGETTALIHHSLASPREQKPHRGAMHWLSSQAEPSSHCLFLGCRCIRLSLECVRDCFLIGGLLRSNRVSCSFFLSGLLCGSLLVGAVQAQRQPQSAGQQAASQHAQEQITNAGQGCVTSSS